MRSWSALLLITVVLAGCTDETPDLTPDVPVETSDPVGNVTAEPIVPVANLTAEVVNGTAPLLVNFTLNGTQAANVTWTLSTNGTEIANGTELPATANHTFLAGAWNVTFNVTLGNETNTTTLLITAADDVVPERIPILLEEVTNSGLLGGPYALTNDPTMAHQCPGFNLGQDGLGCVFLDFSDELAGNPALIQSDAGNVRLAMWDTCAPTGSGVAFYGGNPGDQFKLQGGCIVAWSSVIGDWGSEATFTLQVFDYLPEA